MCDVCPYKWLPYSNLHPIRMECRQCWPDTSHWQHTSSANASRYIIYIVLCWIACMNTCGDAFAPWPTWSEHQAHHLLENLNFEAHASWVSYSLKHQRPTLDSLLMVSRRAVQMFLRQIQRSCHESFRSNYRLRLRNYCNSTQDYHCGNW